MLQQLQKLLTLVVSYGSFIGVFILNVKGPCNNLL